MVQLFPKISQQERLVADYVLSENGEPSEILYDMHDTYITRDELFCSMEAVGCKNKWTGGASQPYGKGKKHEIRERCRMFLHAEFVGHDFSSYDMLFCPVYDNNHWHVHVVNIPTSRVEILSSLPLRRDMIVACSQSSTWNIGRRGDTSTFQSRRARQDASISIEAGSLLWVTNAANNARSLTMRCTCIEMGGHDVLSVEGQDASISIERPPATWKVTDGPYLHESGVGGAGSPQSEGGAIYAIVMLKSV
ncbi:hypothetical protein CK203_008383 [Vitis vinifera]|uniref:Ubiquitin-like protease family profile domain-containing protein n=1 Tax=Vitis vinifera TaxID=29760 RepID=A0A438KNT5_VITVI|nr:hypothetical protein CK203_008383 [Vitis vinifera]